MTQTNNRFFDEVARLMNDAAGVAQGVRREFDTLFRTQAERILRDLDVVKREEFEAVKDMARLAREENEALKARIAALEAKLGGQTGADQRREPAAIGAPVDRPGVLGHSRAFPCLSGAGAAISPRVRGSRTPGGMPRATYPAISTEHKDYSHGDRQGNEGDGASEGRQGGRPGGASRWPRTRRDLRRQQAPAHHLARLHGAAAARSTPAAS